MTAWLLDTHLLLWTVSNDRRLPDEVRTAIEDPTRALAFSIVSLWEVSIKSSLGRPSFTIDPRRLRRLLLDAELREVGITAEHAIAVRSPTAAP